MDNNITPYTSSNEQRLIELGLSSFADTLVCKDGFKLRVQAGAIFESLPKNNIGPWTHYEVEIDFDIVEPLLIPYGRVSYFWESSCTNYFEVPREVVKWIIDSHGGLEMIEKHKGLMGSSKVYSLKTFMIVAEIIGYTTAVLTSPQFQKPGPRWPQES